LIAVTIIGWILKVEIRFQMELAMSTTQETLKSLLEIGESKGFVTFQQVFNAVTKEKSDPERLDKLLTLLEEHGIEIIDDENDD
jgi:hypothetical protein